MRPPLRIVGLEFMGGAKHGVEWDKLDWRTDTGFTGGGSDRFKNSPPLPSYSTTTAENRVCRVCKGTERGQDRKGFTRCRCPVPDFPDRKVSPGSVGLKMQDSHEMWLREVFRVLQPGGFIKAFSGSRTQHRLGAAMEAAGFVDVSIESWSYSSGFPKSLDAGKAIDSHKGLTRPVIGHKRGVKGAEGTGHEKAMPGKAVGVKQVACLVPVTAPASPEAAAFEGWGTALKPAWEPVIVGRKPC